MKRTKTLLFLLLCLFIFPTALSSAQEVVIVEVFSLTLLSPNTSAARNQWALLMENQLPKIGIGIDFLESTGWGDIGPRTWSYPLIDFDYIPTYAEGGFDILFVGLTWELDWDPSILFPSSCSSFRDNFYQYTNPTYDAILNSYLREMNQAQQLIYAHQLQAILYEDLPDIVLIYPKSLFGFKEGLIGIDGNLLKQGIDRYEYWDDPIDHIIKYAIPVNLAEWNCFVQESLYDGLWMQGVYGALFQRTQITNLWEPQIAADYAVISNGLDITVDLDPNAKFSDGSPVLAEDVEFTYELYMTPAVGSSSYSYLNTWFATNSSITAVDTDTIIFNLTYPNAFYYNLLTYGIIDKSEVEPLISTYGYSIFNEVPLTGNVQDSLVKSCGPFVLDTFNTVTSIAKLIPNSHYSNLLHADGPQLSEFYITFVSGKDYAVAELIAGNVDVVDTQYYPEFDDFTAVGVEGVLFKDLSHQEMALNMRHPVFGTGELTPFGTPNAAKAIRKAISHAVPRQVIVDQILEGLGSAGVTACPSGCVGFDESLEPYTYDLDLAIEYMEVAGFDVRRTITPTSRTKTTIPQQTGYENIALIIIMFVGITSILIIRRIRK